MRLRIKRPAAMGKTADGRPAAISYIGYIAPRVPSQQEARIVDRRQQVNKVIGPTFNGLASSEPATALVQRQKEDPTMKLVQFIKSFVREEDGAAAIEYGLIAALIAVAIIAGAIALGSSLNGLFTDLGTCMANPSVANCALGG